MIDLDKTSLECIKSILKKHLPGTAVKAFGSRVTGKAKQYSDLDLVLMPDEPLPISKLNELKLKFSTSDLPIMIDLIDWHAMPNEFRQAIESECQTLIS